MSGELNAEAVEAAVQAERERLLALCNGDAARAERALGLWLDRQRVRVEDEARDAQAAEAWAQADPQTRERFTYAYQDQATAIRAHAVWLDQASGGSLFTGTRASIAAAFRASPREGQ